MPSIHCYFVDKAAAACAAPALKLFCSILHHNSAFTQNLGLTPDSFSRGPQTLLRINLDGTCIPRAKPELDRANPATLYSKKSQDTDR